MTATLISTFVLVNFIGLSLQHGRMMEPVQRSSMWRKGFNTPPNYEDTQLYCGGRDAIQRLGGLCGVCGDPYETDVRENEAGGAFANGIIVRSYPSGTSQLRVSIELTAYHKGYYEFRICPHNNVTTPVSQDCLNRYLLPVAEATVDEGEPTRYYPEAGGMHDLTLFLPPGISCSQCVLQWRYRTGNSWGVNEEGRGCIGCGVQEEFRNCADISIGSGTSGSDIPVTAERQRTPFIPERPRTPSIPERPKTPSIPERPRTPSIPERPRTPSIPERPRTPFIPERPRTPSIPERTRTPSIPERPRNPSIPPRTPPTTTTTTTTPSVITSTVAATSRPHQPLPDVNRPGIWDQWGRPRPNRRPITNRRPVQDRFPLSDRRPSPVLRRPQPLTPPMRPRRPIWRRPGSFRSKHRIGSRQNPMIQGLDIATMGRRSRVDNSLIRPTTTPTPVRTTTSIGVDWNAILKLNLEQLRLFLSRLRMLQSPFWSSRSRTAAPIPSRTRSDGLANRVFMSPMSGQSMAFRTADNTITIPSEPTDTVSLDTAQETLPVDLYINKYNRISSGALEAESSPRKAWYTDVIARMKNKKNAGSADNVPQKQSKNQL